MNIDAKTEQIRALIDLMEEKDLASLEIRSGDDAISLTRHFDTPAPVFAQASDSAQLNAQSTTPAPTRGVTEDAPMVGVFYVAPSPNEAPFVSVGQKVQAGDTLGIIEAMKIMNPLEATQSGIIDAILVDDGDVVQFGQPIVRYKA